MTQDRSGPVGLEMKRLAEENAALKQALGQQQAVLHQRAEPLAMAVLDTVNAWCEMAESPMHPAREAALDLVTKWVSAMDRARDIANRQPSGRLAVVRNGSTPLQ